MKRLVTTVFMILFTVFSFAQIKPPQQTDTLCISSVKYNYTDIRQENWPCSVIYKSTTSFKIGEDEFLILDADKFASTITFTVTDLDNKEKYKLLYEERYSGGVSVIFSGYEFICNYPKSEVKPVDEGYRYVATANLKGRTVNGTLASLDSSVKGVVVVEIWVDNYGIVQKAVAGIEGTTITDKELWQAARKAALGAHFNMSADAPALQKGIISFRSRSKMVHEESVPFQQVEVKPSFMGGDSNQFSKWVNSQLDYPNGMKRQGIQGRVTLQFTVASDGSVVNVKVLRGVHPDLDAEAVRVVSSSPKWEPGKYRNQVVPVTMTFPVIFQLR